MKIYLSMLSLLIWLNFVSLVIEISYEWSEDTKNNIIIVKNLMKTRRKPDKYKTGNGGIWELAGINFLYYQISLWPPQAAEIYL